MAATDSEPSTGPDAGVDDELRHTIEAIEEDDILVVNGDSRTWDVTDVVERSIDDPADDRLHKRVCRLHSQGAVFGLELVEYPDCYEAILHVLETNDWTERDQTYPVQDVEILDRKIPWVVVGNNTSTYHFPDPTAAAYGEAAPACGAGSDDSSYRITRITTVYPGYNACKSCVRHAKPVELAAVNCPKCEKAICHGTLRRVELDAIDGLSITCPRCGLDGVADVELTH